jgi:tetratricopeptide (TPR) repeat protein
MDRARKEVDVKVILLLAFFLGTVSVAAAQQSTTVEPRPAPIVHHSGSSNAAAQAAFDRGLLDYYAYNPEAAEHEFYTAADLDPKMAMAWWGIALSNAPNLNVPPTDDRNNQARYAIERAKVLEVGASPEDRLFIEAAVARFDSKTKALPVSLLTDYRDTLRHIAETYPDDPDAAALYGEASLYVAAGDRSENREGWTTAQWAAWRKTVAALLPYFQSNLVTFPKHVGLLHFYIHAAQMANQSAVAVAAATQLAAFTFPDEDSHLTHMPGHTFFDVGMYEEGLAVGQRSVAMDDAAIDCCHPGFYSAERYYHWHNVSFLLYAMVQTGHASETVAVARRADVPSLIARALVAAGDWQAVLDVPDVKEDDPTIAFARALALAKLGNVPKAQEALKEIPTAPPSHPSRVAIENAMRLIVGAQIALDGGNGAKALELLRTASSEATRGDLLAGGVEMPSIYYYSPHMALAELALKMGDKSAARAALEAELAASPRSRAATQALAQLDKTR